MKQLAYPMRVADDQLGIRIPRGWALVRNLLILAWLLFWAAIGLVLFFGAGSVQ